MWINTFIGYTSMSSNTEAIAIALKRVSCICLKREFALETEEQVMECQKIYPVRH